MMEVKILEVRFCDNGCGLWSLLNAVFPENWVIHDKILLEDLMQALVDFKCDVILADRLEEVAKAFWYGRRSPMIVEPVLASFDGITFEMFCCGGVLEVALLDSSTFWQTDSPLEYVVRWIYLNSYYGNPDDALSEAEESHNFDLYTQKIMTACPHSGAIIRQNFCDD